MNAIQTHSQMETHRHTVHTHICTYYMKQSAHTKLHVLEKKYAQNSLCGWEITLKEKKTIKRDVV